MTPKFIILSTLCAFLLGATITTGFLSITTSVQVVRAEVNHQRAVYNCSLDQDNQLLCVKEDVR